MMSIGPACSVCSIWCAVNVIFITTFGTMMAKMTKPMPRSSCRPSRNEKVHMKCCDTAYCFNCAVPWSEEHQCSDTDFAIERCPRCNVSIAKSGGCNIVKCTACGESFQFTQATSGGNLSTETVIPQFGIHIRDRLVSLDHTNHIIEPPVWSAPDYGFLGSNTTAAYGDTDSAIRNPFRWECMECGNKQLQGSPWYLWYYEVHLGPISMVDVPWKASRNNYRTY